MCCVCLCCLFPSNMLGGPSLCCVRAFESLAGTGGCKESPAQRALARDFLANRHRIAAPQFLDEDSALISMVDKEAAHKAVKKPLQQTLRKSERSMLCWQAMQHGVHIQHTLRCGRYAHAQGVYAGSAANSTTQRSVLQG